MANSADPDQLASSTDLDLHCLQVQDIYPGLAGQGLIKFNFVSGSECNEIKTINRKHFFCFSFFFHSTLTFTTLLANLADEK